MAYTCEICSKPLPRFFSGRERGYQHFGHRDGIDLWYRAKIRTEFAMKSNRKGQTLNRDVYLGETWTGWDGAPAFRIVMALLNDVHHVVMTPQQAIELGEMLIHYGECYGARGLPPAPSQQNELELPY